MTDDADFLERMGRLAGQTTYRVPVEGNGTRFGDIPESCAIIIALCGARGRNWNPGPEIAWARATGIQHKREAVIRWTENALQLGSPEKSPKAREIAKIAYSVATQTDPSISGKDYPVSTRKAVYWAVCLLEQCMWEVLRRAERGRRQVPEIA